MAEDPSISSAGLGGRPLHVPVLRDRVLTLLAPALDSHDAVVLDATLGLGGHSEALLLAHPRLRLIGLDRDQQALDLTAQRLVQFADRIELVHAVYDQIPEVLAGLGLTRVQGVLFDLGVSSMQLDRAERGFSYAHDAPLDMRMDAGQELTAEQIVNSYSVARLARVLSSYGEERFAMRIAQAIGRRRTEGPLTSTAELAEIVRDAIPAATRRVGGHPAKRSFQALRMEVNGELAAIAAAVPAALRALSVGGRIVVLAYHSLEDRIVKQSFAELALDRTPVGLPVPLADAGPRIRLLSKGSEQASAAEIAENSRSASVRLRAAERISEDAA